MMCHSSEFSSFGIFIGCTPLAIVYTYGVLDSRITPKSPSMCCANHSQLLFSHIFFPKITLRDHPWELHQWSSGLDWRRHPPGLAPPKKAAPDLRRAIGIFVEKWWWKREKKTCMVETGGTTFYLSTGCPNCKIISGWSVWGTRFDLVSKLSNCMLKLTFWSLGFLVFCMSDMSQDRLHEETGEHVSQKKF